MVGSVISELVELAVEAKIFCAPIIKDIIFPPKIMLNYYNKLFIKRKSKITGVNKI
ncbi:hypothetical protein GCM10025854_14720 [Tetragenococcus muriaticus]|uniref:Uncharacterized protein n=1 Tax=Tetragenococcus osmophilus TaxID=526944 RepID=A0AA38CWE1_9ENTE|nr:hypothetical protein GCM10025854_14720 [Tetragenococcus muriaticus]GMA71741.1 hypothetical protein GCM10025885_07900 [Tetragenococcus osmophilus]